MRLAQSFLAAAALLAAVGALLSCDSSSGAAVDIGVTADTWLADAGGSDTPSLAELSAPDLGGVACESDAECVAHFTALGTPPGDCRVAVCTSARCELRPRKEGEACDDGLICTVGSLCVQGECRGGSPVVCDDGDPCTADSCVEPGGCMVTPASGASCDDGDPCTSGDRCLDGRCLGGDYTCGACDETTDCEALWGDGNACNGVLACDAEGRCAPTPATVVSCEVPGDPCLVNRCDPATGACVQGPGPDGRPCTDGSRCTWDDRCEAGQCVGTGLDCDDGDACTVDDCDAAGGCTNTPIDCDDGDACTVDGCDPLTGCFHRPVSCDDQNACTTETCDPALGCVYADFDCDDGNACTTDDECHEVLGCLHDTVVCDDQDACTTDACDPATGCTFTDIVCDDEDACTTDACDPATGCTFTDIVCDDQDPCTIDACDPATGCTASPVVCPDDGDACTTAYCDAQGQCQYPVTLVCDDEDACTVDACDPASGCVFTPLTCDDGDACTTNTCDAVLGCQSAPLVCDDGDACTQDLCDSASGCVFPPLVCDDGDACTDDTCDSALGCQFSPRDCDDGIACTQDSCDSLLGCVNDGSLCGLEYDCADGVDNDEDGRTDCRDEECWGLAACLGLYPEIVIVYPPRAALLDGPRIVTIQGHVTAPTGPVPSLDLRFGGVTHTLSPAPGTGAFQLTVTSAPGLNPIVAEAVGADGLGARLVQSYLWSPEWRTSDPADLPGSAIPLALRGYLTQDFFDDGDPSDADDLVGLLIMALETIDAGQLIEDYLPHPITTLDSNPLESGCGAEIDATPHPTEPVWQSVEMDIDLRDGGFELNAALRGITMMVDLVGIGEGCSSLSSVLRIPTLTLMLRLAVSKQPGQPISVVVQRVNVDMPQHLTLDPCAFACGLEFVAAAIIQGMAEEEIEAALPGLVEQYLGQLEYAQDAAVAAPASLLPGAAPVLLTAWLGLEGLTFANAGATLLLDAAAAAPRSVSHLADRVLGRAACLEPPAPEHVFGGVEPLELAAHDDLTNMALFAMFSGGGMSTTTTLDQLGVDLSDQGITEATLTIDAWLPGVATDCPAGGPLWFELGDVAIGAEFLLDGVPAQADLFGTLIAELQPSFASSAEGTELTLDVLSLPFFDLGILSATGGGVDEPRALLDARLDGGLREAVRQHILARTWRFTVPAVDVSALLGGLLPGVPPGISLVPTLTELGHTEGFSWLNGSVEVKEDSP